MYKEYLKKSKRSYLKYKLSLKKLKIWSVSNYRVSTNLNDQLCSENKSCIEKMVQIWLSNLLDLATIFKDRKKKQNSQIYLNN